MNALEISFFIVAGMLACDNVARASLRTGKNAVNYKPAGLLGLFLLSLSFSYDKLQNKTVSIKRFIIAFLALIILFIASFAKVHFSLLNQFNLPHVLWLVLPIIFLPFYHLFFALLGLDQITLYAAVEDFQLRLIISLLVVIHCLLPELYIKPNIIILISHNIFLFVAVLMLFHMTAQVRSPPKRYELNIKNWDIIPVTFLHYAVAVLEFFYALLLVHEAMLFPLVSPYLAKISFELVDILCLAVFLGVISLAYWLFFALRRPPSLRFYKNILLPLSFMFFGLAYLLTL